MRIVHVHLTNLTNMKTILSVLIDFICESRNYYVYVQRFENIEIIQKHTYLYIHIFRATRKCHAWVRRNVNIISSSMSPQISSSIISTVCLAPGNGVGTLCHQRSGGRQREAAMAPGHLGNARLVKRLLMPCTTCHKWCAIHGIGRSTIQTV